MATVRPADAFAQHTPLVSPVARLLSRTHALTGLLFALVLGAILRAPFLSVPMIADEGSYAYVAKHWFDGSGDLYGDLWISRPQGILIVFGLIQQVFGDGVVALRVASWLVFAMTTVAVWWLARLSFGNRAAGLAALLFSVLGGSPLIEGFTANAEVFAALPSITVIGLLLRARLGQSVRSSLIGAGACVSLSIVFKPSGAVMVPLVIAYLCWADRKHIRTLGRHLLWIGSGFVLATLPFVLHGALTGWSQFWFATVSFRSEYQSATSVPFDRAWLAFTLLMETIRPILFAIAAAIYVGIWTVLRGRPFPALSQAQRHGAILLSLWIPACLVGIAMGGDWWAHYLIQAAAPVAIALAVILAIAWERLPNGLIPTTFFVLIVVMMLSTYRVVLATNGDGTLISYKLYGMKYQSSDAVVDYVTRNTEPGMPIYVAFSEPEIYVLADRPAAFRFLYANEVAAYPPAYPALLEMISGSSRPELVIDMEPPCKCQFADGSQAFWDAVEEHYHLETVIDGIRIFRANTPQ